MIVAFETLHGLRGKKVVSLPFSGGNSLQGDFRTGKIPPVETMFPGAEFVLSGNILGIRKRKAIQNTLQENHRLDAFLIPIGLGNLGVVDTLHGTVKIKCPSFSELLLLGRVGPFSSLIGQLRNLRKTFPGKTNILLERFERGPGAGGIRRAQRVRHGSASRKGTCAKQDQGYKQRTKLLSEFPRFSRHPYHHPLVEK